MRNLFIGIVLLSLILVPTYYNINPIANPSCALLYFISTFIIIMALASFIYFVSSSGFPNSSLTNWIENKIGASNKALTKKITNIINTLNDNTVIALLMTLLFFLCSNFITDFSLPTWIANKSEICHNEVCLTVSPFTLKVEGEGGNTDVAIDVLKFFGSDARKIDIKPLPNSPGEYSGTLCVNKKGKDNKRRDYCQVFFKTGTTTDAIPLQFIINWETKKATTTNKTFDPAPFKLGAILEQIWLTTTDNQTPINSL